jgi:hypothetical protein
MYSGNIRQTTGIVPYEVVAACRRVEWSRGKAVLDRVPEKRHTSP